MVLLCLGVFIVGTTFRATADTLNVTATVHAAPLTTPAIITSHYDQQHVNESQADVSGTCPADSYVKLFKNDIFSGVAQCIGGTFTIPTTFAPGPNKLQAKAYNITDNEGPVVAPITVFFDNATVSPQEPATVPANLTVTAVDSTPFRPGIMFTTGNYPTFSGFAPPNSRVTVTIGTLTCRTTASDKGWWSCTFRDRIPAGMQRVEVTGVTPDGRAMRFPTFSIRVVDGQPSLQQPGDAKEIVINATYRYQARYQDQEWHWDVNVEGGIPPYKVTIDWGDGIITNRDRADSEYFTISHAYKQPGVYRPTIRVVDAGGASNRTAIMQLLAIVKPVGGAAPVATTKPSGIEQYLWLVWPTYIAIILMVFSFWLGEMEVARRLRLRRH